MENSLIGSRFSRWLIICINPKVPYTARTVIAKCDCGTIKDVVLHSIKTGLSKSCGCYQKECLLLSITKHGLIKTLLYGVWKNLKTRCFNKNYHQYAHYGGRGIGMYKKWVNDFKLFYDWAMKNGWKQGLQIDRINNNRGYYPSNCRFVTQKINQRNTRKNVFITYKGEKKTIPEWAELFNVPPTILYQRIGKLKWPPEKAFFYPLRGIKNQHEKSSKK